MSSSPPKTTPPISHSSSGSAEQPDARRFSHASIKMAPSSSSPENQHSRWMPTPGIKKQACCIWSYLSAPVFPKATTRAAIPIKPLPKMPFTAWGSSSTDSHPTKRTIFISLATATVQSTSPTSPSRSSSKTTTPTLSTTIISNWRESW